MKSASRTRRLPSFARFARAVASLALIACGPQTAPAPSGDPPPPPSEAPAPPPSPSPPGGELHGGIDVSGHSGTVEWAEVKAAGHTFAFVKATEGVDLEDPAFAGHWPAMKAAGVVRGAYHFYVTEDDPAEQARFFLQTVDLEPGDLAPVVDVELVGHGTKPGLAARLRTFLEIVEKHYGVRPIVYTSPDFWDRHLDDTFGDYPLWIAEYGVDAPRLPSGWQAWHLWQWQADADVPGVEQGADLSHLNRDLDLSVLLLP